MKKIPLWNLNDANVFDMLCSQIKTGDKLT